MAASRLSCPAFPYGCPLRSATVARAGAQPACSVELVVVRYLVRAQVRPLIGSLPPRSFR